MANTEDKIDSLIQKVGDLAVSVKGIETRLDAVEESLHKQEEALHEVSNCTSVMRVKIAEEEARQAARGNFWTKLQPFLTVVFTLVLGGAAATFLHVYG
jgi:hypothetical protein